MTSGKPLSDQEQLYILKWAEKKSWGSIADEIQKLFGESRKPQSLSRWYSNYFGTIKSIQIQVPEDIQQKIEGESEAVISYLFSKTVNNYLLAKSV